MNQSITEQSISKTAHPPLEIKVAIFKIKIPLFSQILGCYSDSLFDLLWFFVNISADIPHLSLDRNSVNVIECLWIACQNFPVQQRRQCAPLHGDIIKIFLWIWALQW